jgi:diguanylate cyclase (GGDEF)-like protein
MRRLDATQIMSVVMPNKDSMNQGPMLHVSAFLSNQPPSRRAYRLALSLAAIALLILVAAAPFAKTPLGKHWAFIPVYESALVISDLITSMLLFGQFLINRSRAMLVLVCAYAFTALMAAMHALSFPGLFSDTGLIGSAQTTAWLYMFWHAGFPLGVMIYTRLAGHVQMPLRRVVPLALVAVGAGVMLLTVMAAFGEHGVLPSIMNGNGYLPIMRGVTSAVWVLSGLAVYLLWQRRKQSVLDMWLMVTMCAWVCDVGLSAVFNAGRFDLGFYAGRVFGLAAGSFILCVLLIENGWMYLRLLDTTRELQRLTTIDALTGIANRRAFDEALAGEWRRALRNNNLLTLLMVDVDHFKLYNDHYGHVAGDDCLRAVGRVLGAAAQRSGELAARYGGEEFAVLLPYLEMHEVMGLAERIRRELAALAIPHAASKVSNKVTISIGIASIRPATVLAAEQGVLADSGLSVNPVALVVAADEALYAAKETGRDRISLSGVTGDTALAT